MYVCMYDATCCETNRTDNRLDNRLYHVNGVLGFVYRLEISVVVSTETFNEVKRSRPRSKTVVSHFTSPADCEVLW